MKLNELVEWENRFIKATRRFPPGRDIPAVMAFEADELRATSLELWRWIAEQLHSIVAKLPETKDGVRVVPCVDVVWFWHDGRAVYQVISPNWTTLGGTVGECYSTQAALEAAGGDR